MRRPKLLLVVPVLLAWLVALSLPAQPAQAEEAPVRLLFVLDSSGSMQEKTSTGEVKIDAARSAMNAVAGQIPDSFSVGLRVFGAKVFSRDDKGSCTDSQLVVPVKSGNGAALRKAIKDYKPYGETPISYALDQGAKDLGGQGQRTMVLVSDGESTCDPDPCELAGKLTKSAPGLRIDVVGLDVSGKAKEQLKCVASRGQGTYYDASDSETLASSLQTLRSRAARPYEVTGQPVVGGQTAEDAAAITAGDWTDELPPAGEADVRYYDVYRKNLGSTLHVAASLNRLGRADAVALALQTPDGTGCGTAADFRADDFGSSILVAAVSAGAETGKPAVKACAEATHLILAVRRADAVEGTPRYTGTQTSPVELTVREELPVTTTEGLPGPAKAKTFAPQLGESPKNVVPGSSFADAPKVKQGYYAATIVPGETQVVLVQQTWGQHLNATLRFGQPSTKLAKQVGKTAVKADIKLFSPIRGRATTTLGGGEDFLNPAGPLVLGAASTPVTYLNRAQAPAKAVSYLPGAYAVVLSLGADPEGQNYVVPYTLNLQVEGKKSGQPVYADASPAPEPPSPPPTSPVEEPGSADGGGLPVVPLIVGSGLLVAAGLAAVVIIRRRRVGAGA